MYRELTSFFTTLTEILDIQVICTHSRLETINRIVTLYKWFGKRWEDHSAHKMFHNRPLTEKDHRGKAIRIMKPSLLRRVVSQLDNVAGEKSALIAGTDREPGRFNSVHAMALAEPKDWREVRGIGKKMSQDIVRAIRNLPAEAVVEEEAPKRPRGRKPAAEAVPAAESVNEVISAVH
jgi:hypothetical protein